MCWALRARLQLKANEMSIFSIESTISAFSLRRTALFLAALLVAFTRQTEYFQTD
jgi:hypothetical protein